MQSTAMVRMATMSARLYTQPWLAMCSAKRLMSITSEYCALA